MLLGPALGDGLLTVLPTASLTTWISIFYWGILGSAVGFSWYYDGLK